MRSAGSQSDEAYTDAGGDAIVRKMGEVAIAESCIFLIRNVQYMARSDEAGPDEKKDMKAEFRARVNRCLGAWLTCNEPLWLAYGVYSGPTVEFLPSGRGDTRCLNFQAFLRIRCHAVANNYLTRLHSLIPQQFLNVLTTHLYGGLFAKPSLTSRFRPLELRHPF